MRCIAVGRGEGVVITKGPSVLKTNWWRCNYNVNLVTFEIVCFTRTTIARGSHDGQGRGFSSRETVGKRVEKLQVSDLFPACFVVKETLCS